MEQENLKQKKERILLCDGWNIFIAMNATTHIVDHNTYPIGALLGTLNQLRTFVERLKPTKIVVVFDGPDAGERRRQIFPEYKGGRRVRARESKVQIMEGEDNIVFGVEGAFQNQFIKLYEFLELLPITVCMLPYAEADDVISHLALTNKGKYECVIVSNDKDYLQLVQEDVMVYRWKTKKLYDIDAFQKEFKLLPSNYIFQKIMLGDTGDKVPGITGVGEKTFVRLQEPLSERPFADIDDFRTIFETIDYSAFKTRETNSLKKALEQKEEMDLGYKLMKLGNDGLLDEQKELLEMQLAEQEDKSLSRLSLKVKMGKNCFNKLYNGFNDDKWIQPFLFLKKGIKISG